MDNGEELIENAEELVRVRRQARKVLLQTVLTAGVLTVLFLLLPF